MKLSVKKKILFLSILIVNLIIPSVATNNSLVDCILIFSNNTSHYGNDESTQTKIESLVVAYNDIQDRLYEIDKSWRNNLIFYGIPTESNLEDEDPYATEEKVRELIKRKLRITREIPFNRVTRVVHGPEFRGHKPIQVRPVQGLVFTDIDISSSGPLC